MSMPIYNWIIIYDDGQTEIVEAEDAVDAVYGADKVHLRSCIRAVIRTDYA